ncbi:MAG TPA: ribonuclease P protein component [Chitinophagaceae bacterium]
MKKQLTLGKDERLKSRKQIEHLFDKGKSFVVAPFRVYFIVNVELPKQKGESGLKFGTGVSSKNFRKAVDRNRIKRLTREAWRLQKTAIKEKAKETQRQLNVFFIYTGKELPDFTTVKDKVAIALKKLADKIDENISSHP